MIERVVTGILIIAGGAAVIAVGKWAKVYWLRKRYPPAAYTIDDENDKIQKPKASLTQQLALTSVVAVGILVAVVGVAWFILSWSSPIWSLEDQRIGLHCLNSEIEAYDGSRLSVNATHTTKMPSKSTGYQMCQVDKRGLHPT